ncbi:UNVERIFIED_CONTAM: hypothetical protein RMT77_015800 [Armadillidium vulgare]
MSKKDIKMKDIKKEDNKTTSTITLDLAKLNLNDKPKLTPYQGKRRSFGWFRCAKCKKDWSSAYSWANTHQQCKTCLAEIYPYRQAKLKRSNEKKDDRPPHQVNLCGKCKALGKPCTRYVYAA